MDDRNENQWENKKMQLNLSHRNLRSLDTELIAAYANSAEYLDLSHNRINNMTWIYEFPHLKCLIMDDNRLREAHFQNLTQPVPNIHTLMLNKNEFSDLETTADILRRIFPNVEYLSLHGNAMCPDNLLLQPFSEFVPYEYNYYRAVLLKSLPNLKFLDHFSLDSLHFKTQTAGAQINQQKEKCRRHQEQRHKQLLLTSTPKDLWSRLKSFLTANSNETTTSAFPTATNNTCVAHYASSTYSGIHSEGNRYITNSDL